MSETFIWPEVEAHIDAGIEILFCPIVKGRAFHNAGAIQSGTLLAEPLISYRVLLSLLAISVRQPALVWSALALASKGSLRVVMRNLAVLPKALWLGEQLKILAVDHIHAHWLSAPATAAMIASKVCGVGYSVTAHRIDISQGNLIADKMRTATFIRAIDTKGQDEIRAHDPSLGGNVALIYLGTRPPARAAATRTGALDILRLVSAARLVEKKGHADLIGAIALLAQRGVRVSLDLFGDGPLLPTLRAQASRYGVGEAIRFCGSRPHQELLQALLEGCYDAAVLPSVTARDGDREGIPAFLMEAMAAGVPVISTDNGGIAELIAPGCGLLVPERNRARLADAIAQLAHDPDLRGSLAAAGRARVLRDFDVSVSAAKLRSLMQIDP